MPALNTSSIARSIGVMPERSRSGPRPGSGANTQIAVLPQGESLTSGRGPDYGSRKPRLDGAESVGALFCWRGVDRGLAEVVRAENQERLNPRAAYETNSSHPAALPRELPEASAQQSAGLFRQGVL